MQNYSPRTRLYVDVPHLKAGAGVALPAAPAHYLRSVLRAKVGEVVEVFNGRDGAFAGQISALGKSAGQAAAQVLLLEQVSAQEVLPAVSIAFAVLKKERTHMVVEKAAELGAARIVPVVSERTQGQAVKQLKAEKLQAYVIEACEQCGRTALPQVCPPTALDALLTREEQILYADEMRAGDTLAWPKPAGHTVLLIGPEGGWSPGERSALAQAQRAQPIPLGPRILRAETAAIAALSLWQANFGDWT